MNENIITAVFGSGRTAKVRPRYRYDQGQVLVVKGIRELPDFYEVHFANEGSTADATPLIGTSEDGVTIPDSYFQSGASIFAYIYVHDEATDGTTVYKVTIPIINRARPANIDPDPEDADIIAQAIVALNENVGKAEESADTAEAAADGAAQSELNAGTYADRAEAAAQAAEASETNASSNATTAQSAAQSAAGSASDAADYMGAAAEMASNATTSAGRASSRADAAASYASQAQQSANSAASAKTDAQTARTQAQGYRQAAEDAATRAGSAATEAGTAKVAAETAQSAAEAAQTAANAAGNNAQTYAGQASQSAAAAARSSASAAQMLAQVQAEGAAQIAAIDTEGQRVIDSIPKDYTGVVSDVADLKSQIDFVMVHMPPGYKAANWANGSGTRLIKWMGTYLRSYLKVTSAGAVSGNEVGFGSASIALDSSVAIDMRDVYNAKFICKYTNTFPSEAECYINLRFLTPSLTSPSSNIITLPPGTNKSITIDINNLALQNNINTSAQPMVILRAIGYKAHTSTGVEEFTVDAYGFEFEDKPLYINSTSLDHNMFRTEPYYAHLFINTFSDAAADTYVPSQSAYDIEIAKRLGFNSIEFNTHVLSDDNIIVLHGSNGTFGTEFAAASGSSYTDAQIQATTISSVDLDWVRENVVYKSKYPKMQTPPLTLAEALHICRENNMIPFLHRSSDGIVDIADAIMGKDNYILYLGTRADRAKSKAVFCTYSNLSEDDIYAYVQAYGTPCIVGTSNYSKFTLSKWAEIVENVHKMGGLMAFAASYMTSSQCDDLWSIGFDMAASGWSLNPCNSGNLVNLCADVGFSDFTVTDGTEADAQLIMSANGTVAPASALSSCFLSGMWLDVTFVGSISVSMGRWITHQNSEVSSETSRTIHLSTYALNSAPTFEIKATSADTVIENIVFKASKL